MAILTIFGGYFGYFLFWIWLDFLIFVHFGTSIPWDKKWYKSQFGHLRLRAENSVVYPCRIGSLTTASGPLLRFSGRTPIYLVGAGRGWYSLCSGRFALAHFVLLILFWNSFCIGLSCPGQVCTVAHFVLKLILHQLIMYRTILHYGQFCTMTNLELAYYALDSFVLRLNLHWLLYWAELAVLAYLSTKLSRT